MTDYLAPEEPVDGDATFRNFQRHNAARAAEHFAVTVTGPPVFGWRLRSVGVPVCGDRGECWLRVVSEEPPWAQGYAWTGNRDANAITTITKPRVLDVVEWSEHGWRDQRAELMTRLLGEPCSPSDVLCTTVNVSNEWWSTLQQSLDLLAVTPTERVHADRARVDDRIRGRFGDNVDTTVARWATAHGDLHWSNLMRPRFGALDWELWGTAPAGTDVATLLCYSLLVPDIAARIRDQFASVLDSPSGQVAQLYVAARLLRRIDGGDYLDLAEPLTHHAHALLAS